MTDTADRRRKTTADVPQKLIDEWIAIRDDDSLDRHARRKRAEEFYFANILPVLIPQLEDLPEHRELRAEGYDTLVSLMGFSPETTVISTSILRPQRLLIVFSENAAGSYDQASAYLTSHEIMRFSQIQGVTIQPTDPYDIYGAVRAAVLRTADASKGGKRRIVDITGGTKIMSATAGQVAWEEGLWLGYVEGKYDEELRRPIPGYERLVRHETPSKARHDHVRGVALTAYSDRNYGDAQSGFDQGVASRGDNRLDALGARLSSAYSAWIDLDRPRLQRSLDDLRRCLAEPRTVELFGGRRGDTHRHRSHLEALTRVTDGDAIALLATFIELAELYRARGRHDFACLLAYRTLEGLVQYRFLQLTDGRFKRNDPDYALLGDVGQLEQAYVALSREIGGRYVASSLPPRVSLIDGTALLCIVDGLAARIPGRDNQREVIEWVKELGALRNQSILAHGDQTLTHHQSQEMLRAVSTFAKSVLGSEHERLVALQHDLQPIPLEELSDRAAAPAEGHAGN